MAAACVGLLLFAQVHGGELLHRWQRRGWAANYRTVHRGVLLPRKLLVSQRRNQRWHVQHLPEAV
jgi:hypothetical protein